MNLARIPVLTLFAGVLDTYRVRSLIRVAVRDKSMKKLTLSAEPEVIEAARRLAELHGTSVSAMFSRFVRVLERREQHRPEIGALAR